MELRLERKYKKDTYTIGNLYVNGTWFCNTIEDKDRKLYQGMPVDYIRQEKIYSETAIPYGRYEITLKVQSPKFSKTAKYERCKGYLPRLLDVRQRTIWNGDVVVRNYGLRDQFRLTVDAFPVGSSSLCRDIFLPTGFGLR